MIPGHLEDIYPLAPLQHGLLYHTVANPDSTVYIEQLFWTFDGALDVEAYRQAWQGVVDRHSILRTGFVWKGLDAPVQVVFRQADLPFREEDWRDLDAAERQARLGRLRQEELRLGFHLETAPLLRKVVVRLRDDAWACVWTFHHLLLDGWSISLVLGEVLARYQALRRDEPLDLPAAPRFRSFMAWLQRQDAADAERYWRTALRGLTAPTTLQLGSLTADPSSLTSEPAEHQYRTPNEVAEQLQALAHQERLTLNTIIQGAWALLLSRYSGEADIVFGATASVRPPDVPDIERMLGLLINTLPVRVRVPPSAKLIPWLHELQAQQAEARDYSYSSLTDIQGWSDIPRGEPLFESLLVFENLPFEGVSQEAGELDLTVGGISGATHTNFPLNLVVHPGSELLLRFLYDPNRFDAATIKRLAGHLAVLLAGLAANPDQELSAFPLMTAAERQQIIVDWNQTQLPYAADGSIASFFEEQVQRTPEAVAAVFDDQQLTYQELNARANQMAHHLRALGVGPNHLVGICLERSLDMVVGLLGILKAGAAYVPLDPHYPAERLAYMLADSGASVLVTARAPAERVPARDTAVVLLDADAAAIAAQPATDPPPTAGGDDLAYVIYTSGSTGHPKGVMLTHSSVINLVLGMDALLHHDPPGVWLAVTSICFDISVVEFFWTLCRGFKVIIQMELHAPAGPVFEQSIVGQIRRHGVTHFQCTPSLAQILAQDPQHLAALRSLRQIVLAGEALPPSLAVAILANNPSVQLLNGYGPTEATVYAAVERVRLPVASNVPIGRPIANTRTYVLAGDGEPVPIGVPGELYIGGAGVASGYLNRPELMAEKFVPDTFGPDPMGRLYRTGDLVRWRPDGTLEFQGRLDHQVKLRGFRIELGEIEATLLTHPAVREAVATVLKDQPSGPRIVAYLVPEGVPPSPYDLRAFLREHLPEYMIPSAFVRLEALPLTPNGKLDRRSLPAPDSAVADPPASFVEPRTPTEELLTSIWTEVLGLERVGVHQNFFDLGGHSLLLLRVYNRLQQEVQRGLSVVDLFQYPTISALSRHLAGDERDSRVDGEGIRAERQRAVLRWGTASGSQASATDPEGVGSSDAVAVVGMSGRFPGASTVDEFWANLRNGSESIQRYSDDELRERGIASMVLSHPSYVKAQPALADVRSFDAGLFGFNVREADLLDPQQRLFLECAWEALEHAGYPPSGTPRSVGVYAGVGLPTYLMSLIANSATHHLFDLFQLALTNDKDYVATRVAYKLNLRGPAVTVQTACSTSLVAVVLACQALLTHQCDLALAGGSSLQIPDKVGYVYSEGGILSPDGHCRAFDVDAQGTVVGSGAGIVVLKRLSEAMADGDTIYAVIRGAALNNDGSNKIGFTAPSVEGQAEVIATAQALAGVSPDSISYVEAHGTGTELGDPIEIAGLTQAFRLGTERTGFCAIGSVKSNIGHLDAAAGIAGLIKTVQALRHREIPPTLNVTQPNPKLELESSPFYVNTELRPWPDGPTSRRAGVSSFGLGGTNAHVVLEAAPPLPEAAPPARPAELLLLSAATPTALKQASANLAAYFVNHANANLADVAYTLHVGRAHLPHRLAVVARTPAEAAAALASPDAIRVATAVADDQAPSVAFMFAGAGAQYPGMGRELYATEPVYRSALDDCLALLPPELSDRLRGMLCSGDVDAETIAALESPPLGLPALFATQYALTRVWRAWGVEPSVLIGHSVGEYAAACLAGVLSLEDALALVVLRGELFGTLPTGGMTSVQLGEAELVPLLGPALSLAAVNADDLCVASGPVAELERLERDLDARGTSYRRVKIAVAAHSRMVEPILDEFETRVAATYLQAPRVPYVSTLTGTWITARQATDPAYWRRHLQETVRFVDGVGTLLDDPHRILLEVGPGHTLARLARRHRARQPQQTAIASLPHPNDPQPDLDVALLAAGRLWAAGVPLDPAGLWPAGGRRVALPTYPFERQLHWIDATAVGLDHRAPLARRTDPADWLYAPSWRRVAHPVGNPDALGLPDGDRWLIFCDREGLGRRLAERLRSAGRSVACVMAGAGFTELGQDDYLLDPRDRPAYDRLLDILRSRVGLPERIVHLWTVSSDDRDPGSGIPDRATLDQSFYSLLFLGQALGECADTQDVDLAVVSGPAHVVLGDEIVQPERAAILGPCKVLPQEYPGLVTRAIDIGRMPVEETQLTALLDRLLDDLSENPTPAPIAYRGPHRWVQEFEAIRRPRGRGSVELREQGVYLITGGLGGVGLAIAAYLAKNVKARLVLVGRSAFPAREAWDRWLAEHGDDDPTSARIHDLRALEADGGEVTVERADVTDLAAVTALVSHVIQRFGALHGVIHAAGVVNDGATQLKSPEIAASVLAPKIDGTLTLASALRDVDCDFLALCSSLSAILPAAGQIDYCAANAFQDAFANARDGRAKPHVASINWDAWEDVGMWARIKANATGTLALQLDARPERIRSAEGAQAFVHVLETGLPQVIVSPYDVVEIVERSRRTAEISTPIESVASQPALATHERPDVETSFVAPRDELEEQLATLWQVVLGIERVGVHDNFFSLGGDSILGIQVAAQARRAGLSLTSRMLYQQPTVAELAAALQPAPMESTHTGSAPIPLTPIQRWFFERNLLDPHHFNQSAVLETPPGIDSSLIQRALNVLVEHHDALRLRYVTEQGQVIQTLASVGDAPPSFTTVDVSALSPADLDHAIVERASSLQPSLDLEAGSLVSAAYFDGGPMRGGQLLVVVHHLVVDGVSWRILIEDLQLAYEQLRTGQVVQLPPTTTSFADWSHRLQEYAQTAQVREEPNYWRAQLSGLRTVLPANRSDRVSTEGDAHMVEAYLTGDETRAVLREVPRALRARINAVLLAALTRAVAEWTGQSTLVVNLEGHGREPIAEDVDLTRTVGWFTTMYPVLLDISGATSMTDSVRAIRASLQQIPRQGIGYGLLRYPGTETPVALELEGFPPPEISFNYLGQFDQLLAEPGAFRLSSRAVTGPNQSPRQVRAHVLDAGGAVIDGQMRLTCTFSETLHTASAIQGLMDSMVANLRTLIADIRSGVAAPREFPLAGLDQQRLDSLLGRVRRPSNRADG